MNPIINDTLAPSKFDL